MKSKNGFTIVELLIVIVVIAILAAISFVTYNRIREMAYDAKVDTTLDQIEKLVKSYVTKGHSIRQKYYNIHDFYANPGGGLIDEGLPIYAGGGLGADLINKGLLNENLQEPLKGGPTRDSTLKNRIKTLNCGKNKLFILIESYSGIEEAAFNKKYEDLRCSWNTEVYWRKENGLPPPSMWVGVTFNDPAKPYYKYREIDL